MVDKALVAKRRYICYECEGYFRVKTGNRIRMVTDPGTFEEWFTDMEVSNPLDYKGYEDKLLKWYVVSLEETVAESFEENQRLLHIISLFTLVAIVISIMGFVGMSLFFIRQRKKEIGLRKIMGSTSQEVMSLMLRTFLLPLFVSFIIAIPLAWNIMSDWLTNFSYRITLSPWMLLVPCLFSLLIAFLSVFVQIGRAVRANPIESIRTE